jgi:hypothetical protein
MPMREISTTPGVNRPILNPLGEPLPFLRAASASKSDA